MKRYALAQMIGNGSQESPFRPDVAGSFVMVGPERGGRCLVKIPVADGTPADNATIADLDTEASDVTATALGGAARTTIKNRLTASGIDIAQFDADSVDDRRKLLRFLLRRWLNWPAGRLPSAIDGYDVG